MKDSGTESGAHNRDDDYWFIASTYSVVEDIKWMNQATRSGLLNYFQKRNKMWLGWLSSYPWRVELQGERRISGGGPGLPLWE